MNETVTAPVDWVVMALLLAWLILSLCIVELLIEPIRRLLRRHRVRQERKSAVNTRRLLDAAQALRGAGISMSQIKTPISYTNKTERERKP